MGLLAVAAMAGCSQLEIDPEPGLDGGTTDATPPSNPDAGPPDASGPRSMVLLYTSDEHSEFIGHGPAADDFPVPLTDEIGRIKGGLLRRAAVLDRLEDEARRPPFDSDVVVVSSGGRTTGTLFQLANLGLGIDFAVAKVMGYDVLGIGNTDLELGVGIFETTVRTGGVSAMFDGDILDLPVVVSNLRFSMTVPDDDGLSQLYLPEGGRGAPLRRLHIQRFGDLRVGFVGAVGLQSAFAAPLKFPLRFSLATEPFETCSLDAQCPGSVCLPPVSNPTALSGSCAVNTNELDVDTHGQQLAVDVASVVSELRRSGVDLVVALVHAGVDTAELQELASAGLGPERATRSETIALAKGVDTILGAAGLQGIDVIVGGFTGAELHAPIVIDNPMMPNDRTVIVQAGEDGEWVGALRLQQSSPQAPWTVDTSYSRLEPIDSRVSTATTTFSHVTKVVLEALIDNTMDNLEGTPVAVADDIIFPGEQCDGPSFPNGGQCISLVPDAVGGDLGCFENRQFDMSSCLFAHPSCGDGARDGTEMCDREDLGGARCEDFGYEGGNLACFTNCAFDVSACERNFPSALEAILDVVAGVSGLPIIHDDPDVRGDLYFLSVGRMDFDVGETAAGAESNLLNFYADGERWALNRFADRPAADPVRVVLALNGLLRGGLYKSRTEDVSLADMFRLVPLGLSPQEGSPGWAMADFWLEQQELRELLEYALGFGEDFSFFWPGVSGMRVEYDPSRPEFDPDEPGTTGRVVTMTLVATSSGAAVPPWRDGAVDLEPTPLYDVGRPQPFLDAQGLVHVGASMYLAIVAEGLGICPRDANGIPNQACQPCTVASDCPVALTSCDESSGRCVGFPGAFDARSLMPFLATRAGGFLTPGYIEHDFDEELKDAYALLLYMLVGVPDRTMPDAYAGPVPRRICCAGASCGAAQTCQ